MLRAWADSYQHEAVYQSIRGVSSPCFPSEVKTERMTLQLLAPHICSCGVGGKRWTLEVCFFDYWGGGRQPTNSSFHTSCTAGSLLFSPAMNPAIVGGGAAHRAQIQNVNNGDMIGNTPWNRLLIEGFHPTWQHV